MRDKTAPRLWLARAIRRRTKIAARYVAGWSERRRDPAVPVFVLGSQRSGTRLPLLVLEQAPDVITYTEGTSPLFRGVMLREDAVLHEFLRRTPFHTVVLKPICESHRAPEFLASFRGARVVWIFRDFRDAVNSASTKWGSGLRALGYVAAGDPKAGWRMGGLTPEKLRLVRELYAPDLSLHAANALMWYLRNSLFFDLQLQSRSDVLLVRYEDLAQDPNTHFPEVCSFAGCRFEAGHARIVYGSSVGRRPFPAIPGRIEELCDMVHQYLLRTYRSRRVVGSR